MKLLIFDYPTRTLLDFPYSTQPVQADLGEAELAQISDRLDIIMNKLTELLERVAQLTTPPANPTVGPTHQPADEHADDVEVSSMREA